MSVIRAINILLLRSKNLDQLKVTFCARPVIRSLTQALLVLFLFLTPPNSIHEIKAFDTAKRQDAEAAFVEADKLRAEQLEASNLRAIDKYREAANVFQSNSELQRSTTALRNAGEILQLLGNSSEALICYRQAFALTKKTGDLLERGKLLNDLAYLHFMTGNTRDAHQNSLAAMSIARRLGNREIQAAALSNLGEALYLRGEVARAQTRQQQSLDIWRELNNSRGQAMASIALGYNFRNLGQPEKALRSYAEGLSLARQANDHGIETVALIAIGNIKRKIGNNQEALESYAAARVIAERIGDQTSQATILGGMGSIHHEMGDKRQALHYIGEATKFMERKGNEWGTAEGKLQLGRIHHSLGDEEQALQYLTEALSLFQSLGMPRLQSATLRAIGLVYDSLGDTSNALESHQKALKLTRSGEDQREEAYTFNHIGRIYEKLNDTNRASKYYRRGLQLSRRSADQAGEALSLYNLAHLERDRENLPEARQLIEAALEIVESQRTNVSSQDLRTSYFATVRNTYDIYIDILMRLHRKSPHLGLDTEAFAISEKARARSFLELLRESRASVREGVDPALLSREQQLNEALNAKAQLHVQLLAARQNDEAARINQELETLVSELAQVRDQIRLASPRLATLNLPEPLSLREVQQRVLDDETVLLEYALGDDRSYVWVVTRTTVFCYELAARAEIETSAQRLYSLITAPQLIQGESIAARTERLAKADAETPREIAVLSNLVLGPLAGRLDKKKILVVLDGRLQYIPFQLLTAPDSGELLIAKHEIVNSPSASTLALLQTEAAKRRPGVNSVAVLADPVFEADDPRVKHSSVSAPVSVTGTIEFRQSLRDAGISPDGVEIPRLIASGTEADGIMAVAPWRTGLKAVGFAANRERVLSTELASYRIVHFATHGIINNERPELSGIVLSLFDSEGRSQNGFLRLHDIYNLRLPADLVVLSACSTGLGKDVRGEGLIGLTRGFMYAGASGVVASLWKVDDDATAELMKHFYEGIFKKELSPAAALREAQLALSRQKRWQSPYYWAGFVIQGQSLENEKFTEPFPNRTQTLLLATVGGLLVLASIFVIRRTPRRTV